MFTPSTLPRVYISNSFPDKLSYSSDESKPSLF